MSWYAYVGDGPAANVASHGLHEAASRLHSMYHEDGSSWGLAEQGFRAWAEGMTPSAAYSGTGSACMTRPLEACCRAERREGG